MLPENTIIVNCQLKKVKVMKNKGVRIWLRVGSYLLVAAVAASAALLFTDSKMSRLQRLIDRVYIEDVDWQEAQDAAASALVDSLPDGWSYYISAQEYESYRNDKENSYVGVGITVIARSDGTGLDIVQVEPGSSALEAGILPGDVLVQVEGTSVAGMDVYSVADMIKGEVGGQVKLTVLREGQTLEFTLTRAQILRQVATGELLDGNIGYITVANFNENSAQQAIDAVEQLMEQGAQALIFDVRNNPGGYKSEMVKLLDYLLPEGDLFRSVDYRGIEETDRSDESCVELPMAVLINSNSYSAAEFFAAALEEYDWAVTVGEPTVGKGHFQLTYELSDGSAVALSVGKYYTPNGVSLADVGGLKPNVEVTVDEKTAALIYAGTLAPEEDTQLQAAVEQLTMDN